MNSLEALEVLSTGYGYGRTTTSYEFEEAKKVIERDLNDFEWLKSKLNIAFISTLPPLDVERIAEILKIKTINWEDTKNEKNS